MRTLNNPKGAAPAARPVWLTAVAAAALAAPGWALADPFVELQTSQGRMVLELFPDKAPLTVENFLRYIDSGHYVGTVFHRSISGFMVQGGGYDMGLHYRPTAEPIENEAARCLKNARGTVAMARTMEPLSTTTQFFINLTDNAHLNHVKPEPGYQGYCAFARVVEGMDVAERISTIPTAAIGPFPGDVPVEPVQIVGATRIEAPALLAATSEAVPVKMTPESPRRSRITRTANRKGTP